MKNAQAVFHGKPKTKQSKHLGQKSCFEKTTCAEFMGTRKKFNTNTDILLVCCMDLKTCYRLLSTKQCTPSVGAMHTTVVTTNKELPTHLSASQARAGTVYPQQLHNASKTIHQKKYVCRDKKNTSSNIYTLRTSTPTLARYTTLRHHEK